MFHLLRGTIGEQDSLVVVGIWSTWNEAAKDMNALGYSQDSFYIIKEVN